jgi:tetratricopeptide (TPR) repeat protein
MNTLPHKPVAFLHSGFKNTSIMKKLIFAFFTVYASCVTIAQPSLQEGIKMLDNENYKGALDQFNGIAKSDPKNGAIYYYIGEVSYLQDNAAEAEKAYKKGLSINSNCPECKVGLGKLLLDQGNQTGAQENFESAMRVDKKNPEMYFMVGDAYLISKHPDANKAVTYLGNARDMNAKVAKYWARLGDAYEMLGDNGQAMTCYETAVGKDPNNTAAYISIAHIWTAAKQYDTAIVYLKKAIQLSPNDAGAYKDLIELYIRTNQYDKVTPLLTKYTELTGDDIDAKVRLVKFLTFQAKDYDRAIELGEQLLKTNPEQYTTHRWLAWAYGEKGMPQQSYDHSKMLFDEIAKKPDRKAYPSDYEYMAKAAMKLGNIEEASHIYRKFIELDSSRAYEIYGMLAKAFYDTKNYEQAIAYYLRKSEVKALTVADLYYLGVSYYLIDQNDKADSAFIKVLSITPDYMPGWKMRIKIANAKDTLEPKQFLAKEPYEKFLALAINDKEKNKTEIIAAANYLAFYYVQIAENQGEKVKAEQALGTTYTMTTWKTACYNKAIEYYEMILSLDPADEDAKHYVDILKEQNKLNGGR